MNKLALLSMLVALLLSLGWVALVRRCFLGRFQVKSDSPQRFEFVSDTGAFTVDRAHATLAWKQDGSWRSLKLENISALDYRVHDDDALATEWLMGFDFMDLYSRYRDTVEWHEIAAVVAGERIPLFRSGRLQRREFLMGWAIAIEEALLIRVGVLKDVEQQAGQALEQLQSRLGRPGEAGTRGGATAPWPDAR